MSEMTDDNNSKAKRTLQVAMFADVVGYSRLMGDDELATHAAVKKYIAQFEILCRAHDGKIVQVSGDGIFAIFARNG